MEEVITFVVATASYVWDNAKLDIIFLAVAVLVAAGYSSLRDSATDIID